MKCHVEFITVHYIITDDGYGPIDWSNLVDLPSEFVLNSEKERLLLGNSIAADSPGCIVFASDWQLNLMAKADSITADGTFSTAPPPFAQVYSIIANFHENRRNVLVCMCLLPDKTFESYKYVWELLSHSLKEPLKSIRYIQDI